MSESKSNSLMLGEKTIKQVLNILLDHKEENLIFGVRSPPGSGKSTTLIKGMHKGLKEHLRIKDKSAIARIFITEPTIAATIGLFDYMTTLYSKDVKIGYSAESIVRYDEKTEIVYCVGPHLKNIMLNYFDEGKPIGDINFCDVIVLDECHQNTLYQETIVGLYLTAFKAGLKVPKLVLMSATLSMKELGFEGLKVVTANYKPFSIRTEYSVKSYKVDAKDLYDDIVDLILTEHITTPIKSKGIDEDETASEGRTVIYPGYDVWIVFCPGEGEVISSTKKLQDKYEEKTTQLELDNIEKEKKGKKPKKLPQLEVLAAYGKMGAEGYKSIFSHPEKEVRRVIFCTNIIEASVTIEFATRVYDAMREKYTASTPSGALCLILGYVSKSSADQRRGRTGRVCPGYCWRAMPESEYNKLSEQRVAEAQRVPLHNVIIELMNVGLDPNIVFRERINKENLDSAMYSLEFLGMLKEDKVTPKGRFAAKLPLSVHGSAILYEWCVQKYNLFTGIVIVCLIDNFEDGYLFYPSKGKAGKDSDLTPAEFFDSYFKMFAGETDIETILILWHHIMNEFNTLLPKKWALSRWCKEHSLNRVRISNALNSMSRLVKIFHRIRHLELQDDGKTGIQEIVMKGFNIAEAVTFITPILRKTYSNMICVQRGSTYRCGRSPITYIMGDRNPLTKTQGNFREIIPLKVKTNATENKDGNAAKKHGAVFITFSAPVSDDYAPKDIKLEYGDKLESGEDTDEDDEEAIDKAMHKKTTPNKSLNRRRPSIKRNTAPPTNRRTRKQSTSSDSSSTSPPPKPKKKGNSSSSPAPSKVIVHAAPRGRSISQSKQYSNKNTVKRVESSSPPRTKKMNKPTRKESSSPPRTKKINKPTRKESSSPPRKIEKSSKPTPTSVKTTTKRGDSSSPVRRKPIKQESSSS